MTDLSKSSLFSKLARITKVELPLSRFLFKCAVYSVTTKENAIALTFDDGPTKNTDKLLQVLEENGAKATFFNIGNKLKEYRALMEELHDHGHELANHTWDHVRFHKLSVAEMLDQLDKTNRAIQEITGQKPAFMRAPGKNSTDLRNVLVYLSTGLKAVYDTVSPPDYQRDCPMTLIRDTLLDMAQPGNIFCLHDMHPHTRDALAESLPILKSRGYRFLTLSEMEEYGKLSPFRHHYVPTKYREYTQA